MAPHRPRISCRRSRFRCSRYQTSSVLVHTAARTNTNLHNIPPGFRHFRSLRTLERDHGWIATLLEEAENERMHLLLCLNKFQAGKIDIHTPTTRLTLLYIIYPSFPSSSSNSSSIKSATGPMTRTMVVAAQVIMVPVLMGVYAVNPTAMHRFVGYLEETACHTYVNIINHAETPGTHLYEA